MCNEVGFKNGFIVANGDNFADALAVAPIASIKGMPIVLTKANEMPQNIKKLLNGKDKFNTYVVGGTGVVSEEIKKDINRKRLGE